MLTDCATAKGSGAWCRYSPIIGAPILTAIGVTVFNPHTHGDHIGSNRELWLAPGKRAVSVVHCVDAPLIESPGLRRMSRQRYVELRVSEETELQASLESAGEGDGG